MGFRFVPQVNVPQVVVVPKDATQARVFMGIAGGGLLDCTYLGGGQSGCGKSAVLTAD